MCISVHFRMISSVLEVLEYAFTLSPNDDGDKNSLRLAAIEVTSNLLTLPTPSTVQMHTFTLLAALHGSKSQYHAHKVNKTIFTFIFQQFYQCGLIFHFFYFSGPSSSKTRFRIPERNASHDRSQEHRRRKLLSSGFDHSKHCNCQTTQFGQIY